MGTRSAIKKVHANFARIQGQLDAVYNQYSGDEKVTGGIVGIWASMSDDAILRTQLVKAGEPSLC